MNTNQMKKALRIAATKPANKKTGCPKCGYARHMHVKNERGTFCPVFAKAEG